MITHCGMITHAVRIQVLEDANMITLPKHSSVVIFVVVLAATLFGPTPAASALSAGPMLPHDCWASGWHTEAAEAGCPEEYGPFKVQVWCTWAGSGISPYAHRGWNWAQCNRGSVSEIEIIF